MSLVRAALDYASFKHLIEDSRDAMIIVDDEHRIHYANPALARLLGYSSAADVFGHPDCELVHGEDHEVYRSACRDPQVLRWVRNDGSTVLVHSVTTPIEIAGEPALLVTGRALIR